MNPLFVFAAALILASCAVTEEAQAPIIDNEHDDSDSLYASTLHLPVEIDLSSVFKEANSSIPLEFKGKEQNCDGVSYEYTFNRKPIQFSGINNGIRYTIPASYAVKLNYCPKCTDLFSNEGVCVIPRIYASCGIDEPKRRVEFDYFTQISLDKNFRLQAKTSLERFKSIDPCKITVFQYNATERLEEEMLIALKDGAKDIDKQIEELPIQQEIDRSLRLINEPIDLKELGKLYLNPGEIKASPLIFKGDKAQFNLDLVASPSIGRPTTHSDRKAASSTDGFSVQLPIRIAFDSLSYLLQSSIAGQSFRYKKKEIVLDSVSVFGMDDEQLKLKVKFSGSKNGTIYLSGTPVLDRGQQVISMQNIQLTLESKNLLLKSAKWLLDRKIDSTIEAKFQFKLADYISSMQDLVKKHLNGKIADGLVLKTQLDELNLLRLQQDKSYLETWIEFKGGASIQIIVQ